MPRSTVQENNPSSLPLSESCIPPKKATYMGEIISLGFPAQPGLIGESVRPMVAFMY